MNKKKLQSGLKIIAFIFPFVFIGPSVFLKGNMPPENLLVQALGVIMMLIAIFGAFLGLKKILDSIFDRKSNE